MARRCDKREKLFSTRAKERREKKMRKRVQGGEVEVQLQVTMGKQKQNMCPETQRVRVNRKLGLHYEN